MVEGILTRLKIVFGCKTDLQLAASLGMKQQTLSSWRQRGSCDIPFIMSKVPANTDLNWLLRGDGVEVIEVPPQIEESEILQELKKLRRDMKSMEKQVKNIKEELARENEVEEAKENLYKVSNKGYGIVADA